jgi:hypothetical protein
MSVSYLIPRSYEFHRENSETFITVGVMGSYFEYGRVSMFNSKEFSFLLNFSGKAFAWVVKAQSFKVCCVRIVSSRIEALDLQESVHESRIGDCHVDHRCWD